MTEHTPGPWFAKDWDESVDELSGIIGPSFEPILVPYERGYGDNPVIDCKAADIRLILAAPNLLVACKTALAFIDRLIESDQFNSPDEIGTLRDNLYTAIARTKEEPR